RSADGENAGMVISAVTEIGEDMRRLGERRLTDPRHAFAAHLRYRRRVAIHPDRHVVAADARGRATAFRDTRRGVVRTAGAEIGHAFDRRLGILELPLERGAIGEAIGDARRAVEAADAGG